MKQETDFDAIDRVGEAYVKAREKRDALREPYNAQFNAVKRHEHAINKAKHSKHEHGEAIQKWEKHHPIRSRFSWESKEIKNHRKEIDRLSRSIPKHEQSMEKHWKAAKELNTPELAAAEKRTRDLKKEHDRLLEPEQNTVLPQISSRHMDIPKGVGSVVDRAETERYEAHQKTLKERMEQEHVIRPPADEDRKHRQGHDL